jgi:hypothetical protein
MLRLLGPSGPLCDGLSRRELLRIGGLGLGSLALPELFRLQARGTEKKRRKVRSVLLLFMWGGPSQLETFDLKPEAPEGVRSVFRPIATRTSGIRICEHLPRLAERTERYAILRSVTHTGVNHGTSSYHMLTGRIHITPGTLRHPTPNDHPSVGSAVQRFGPQPAELPASVSLPSVLYDGDGGEVPGQGPGLLGQRHAPFYVHGDPTRPDFSLETLSLPTDVDGGRLRERVGLHTALERTGESLAKLPSNPTRDGHYEQAFRLLQSPAARKAFRLRDEPAALRERYGVHHFGQSCLLARRLVEAGVPLVTVYWNSSRNTDNQSWDTHDRTVERMRDHLLPAFDLAMAALLDDLYTRGLLDGTLVMWMGEFGRTPKLNRAGGRDHWGFCQSVLMAGGGVKGGQVYGSSDAQAAYAADKPVSPDDLAATVFDALGVPLDTEVTDPTGRPLALCLGHPVRGVF